MRSPKRLDHRLQATVLLVASAAARLPPVHPSRRLNVRPGGDGVGSISAAPVAAVSGNVCPQVFDASTADFYPIRAELLGGLQLAGVGQH